MDIRRAHINNTPTFRVLYRHLHLNRSSLPLPSSSIPLPPQARHREAAKAQLTDLHSSIAATLVRMYGVIRGDGLRAQRTWAR